MSPNMPLAALLGAILSSVQDYNSNGLALMESTEAADEAEALVAKCF
jgi:hypothetical protein